MHKRNRGHSLGVVGEAGLGYIVEAIQFAVQHLEAIEAHLRAGDLLDAVVAVRTDAIVVGRMMAVGLGVVVHRIRIARLVAHFLLSAATAAGHATENAPIFSISPRRKWLQCTRLWQKRMVTALRRDAITW